MATVPRAQCVARSARCVPPGVFCAAVLALLLSACSGGNAPANGPVVPDLAGDRKSADELLPSIDLSKALTPEHRELARLLPGEALHKETSLDQSSVKYLGWDADTAQGVEFEGAAKGLPCVYAEYLSSGFSIVRDAEKDPKGEIHAYPQKARLYLIRTPEEAASALIGNKLAAILDEAGYQRQDPLHLALGFQNEQKIERWVGVVPQADHDLVYVAYLKWVGDLLIYAVEEEKSPKITGPGNTQLPRVTDQRGTRVGAAVIALILHALKG